MAKSEWKREVHERDNHQCKICGSRHHLTVHHKLPVARKGRNHPDNGVCWCTICHRAYHEKWGLTESDDYGNPLEEYHGINSSRKKSKKRRKHHRR